MASGRVITEIHVLLWTATENTDQPILNTRSVVLYCHFSFVSRVTVEYKFNYSLPEFQ
jgi:hypothetical protein